MLSRYLFDLHPFRMRFMKTQPGYFVLLSLCLFGCSPHADKSSHSTDASSRSKAVTVTPFGALRDGTPVSLYTMTNKNGVAMRVMNYGGIVVSLEVPGRDGNIIDVVLGYDSLRSYEERNPFFGALVGRYANRIAKGKLMLDGQEYELTRNSNGNHIHGGKKGFDKVFWKIEEASAAEGVALKLSYLSKDLEEGYPGNLSVTVTYTLSDDNTVVFDYEATTDKRTIVNLTQHSYFNLNGGKANILNHELSINADRFLPVDETLIPTGKLQSVEGTPLDFRAPVKIGERINDGHQQMVLAKGYDHCWILNGGERLRPAAQVYDSLSGIEMTVKTTEPGVQLYTGNFLDGTITGKNGIVYQRRAGFCLETQHFPDSPNQNDFPSVVLSPGEKYTTQTSYHFSVR
jgi:aldose 1-epimerase